MSDEQTVPPSDERPDTRLLPCPFCGWDKPFVSTSLQVDGEIISNAFVHYISDLTNLLLEIAAEESR